MSGRRVMFAATVLAMVGAGCSPGAEERAADDVAAKEVDSLSTRTPSLALSEPLTVLPEGGLNPTVVVDAASSAVYAAWAQEVPHAKGAAHEEEASQDDSHGDPVLQVVVARSQDGGKTFADPVVASPATERVMSSTVAPTQLAVDSKGRVLVLYGHDVAGADPAVFEYGRTVLHLVASDDGAKAFGSPVEVGAEAVEGAFTTMGMHNLFVAPDDDVYVTWLDDREQIAAAIAAKGKPASKEGHGADEEPPVHLRMARSDDGGRSFARSVLVTKPTCACCGTKTAQGKDTALFASTRSDWKELKESYDSVRDPFLSVSKDDGITWAEPTKIHDDGFKISGCPDISAGLAVDSQGRLHAAWYTGTEREPGPGVYYAVSDDQGASFSKPLALLTDAWVPYGDVKLSIDGSDNAWVAFEDRRGDDDQIRLVRIAPDGTAEVS
ncbi:MAG: sialidase family protein, partial [Acidimicrobiia bacterium]